MHLHHLNNPSDDSDKLSFIAFTCDWKPVTYLNENEKFHYFEYNENHESTTSIERIKRFSFSPPFKDARVIGSSNGLICVSQGPEGTYICNPITKEYVMLSEIKTDCDRQYHDWTSGFGYVSSSNEYKVVGMYLNNWDQYAEIHVYTLGNGDGWRNLGKLDLELELNTCLWCHGVLASEALYWKDNFKEMIVTFDLAEEKFCENILPPPLTPDGDWETNFIGVLNGILFIAAFIIAEGIEFYDIWLLAKKNDNHDEGEEHQSLGWSKEFRIDDDESVVALMKSGGVLTFGHGRLRGHYLYICDPKASTSKPLAEFKERINQVFPHRNTLVSLKELGEEETKVMESTQIEETKALITL
ncbi:F-box protein CPR1-like [Papaver somniferum]|uniref:F-box protein CPR1-like n=1 Tax=Papaver somniferum TaxID=3469 RepID=UPI000E704A7B|nr:F-box protein CPR1-like [Papaver somniferum]